MSGDVSISCRKQSRNTHLKFVQVTSCPLRYYLRIILLCIRSLSLPRRCLDQNLRSGTNLRTKSKQSVRGHIRWRRGGICTRCDLHASKRVARCIMHSARADATVVCRQVIESELLLIQQAAV